MKNDIIWKRPSGLKITTKNTKEMVDYAEKAGWKKSRKPNQVSAKNDNSEPDHNGCG